MILSISRRTDIVYYYSEWFLNRLSDGYFYVPDKLGDSSFCKLDLKDVEGMVFFTRNSLKSGIFLDKLDSLKIPYYFNYSITCYPVYENFNLNEQIESLISLSKRIGKERVIFHYSPIIINSLYPLEYNLNMFSYILERVKDYVSKVYLKFYDSFTKTCKRDESLGFSYLDKDYYLAYFVNEAKKLGVEVTSCGISPCVDVDLLNSLGKCNLRYLRKYSQEETCKCCYSVDLGSYNTCMACCSYCYSYKNLDKVLRLSTTHDPKAITLYEVDKLSLREREFELLERHQDSLF